MAKPHSHSHFRNRPNNGLRIRRRIKTTKATTTTTTTITRPASRRNEQRQRNIIIVYYDDITIFILRLWQKRWDGLILSTKQQECTIWFYPQPTNRSHSVRRNTILKSPLFFRCSFHGSHSSLLESNNSSCYFYHLHHIPCTDLSLTAFIFFFYTRFSISSKPCALFRILNIINCCISNKQFNGKNKFYSIFIFIFITTSTTVFFFF